MIKDTQKYRAWDEQDKIMWEPLTLEELIMGDWELRSADDEYTLPHRDYLQFAHNYTIWMRSTGLQDKNKKDIYEGDVVVFYEPDSKWVFEIVYVPSKACYSLKSDNRFMDIMAANLSNRLTDLYSENIEVIGNIHETPELLK